MISRLRVPVALAAALFFVSGCATWGYDGSYRSTSVHIGPYYDELSPYGDWIHVAPHGWVWAPARLSIGWRPFTVGYWAYSDWGWMWISDDPWGALPYHYGRWTYEPFYGWTWVPDDVWGPGWVSWRYG